VGNRSSQSNTPVAGFQPAVSASTFVNGEAHLVPLAVCNRGEWFDQRTDRNRNVRRAPVDCDYGLVSCVQQKVGCLRIRRENSHGEENRERAS
jgi:hypothetical protein